MKLPITRTLGQPIPERLRLLANAVARNRRFNISNPDHCIVAIGLRLNENGSMRRTDLSYLSHAEQRQQFAQKFSMSESDVLDLWIGFFGSENMVYFSASQSEQTAQAVALIGKFVEKYRASKLDLLARAIEANAKEFSQLDCGKCITGIGMRMNDAGELDPDHFESDCRGYNSGAFARKFGITSDEASALFAGDFYKLDESLGENDLGACGRTGAAKAVAAVRWLADKYRGTSVAQ